MVEAPETPFITGNGANGQTLDNYIRQWTGPLVAPAGAVRAQARLRKQYTNNDGSPDSYLFFVRPFFGETVPNAQSPQPWTPGGLTYLDGSTLITDSVTARQIASNTITANEIATRTIVAGNIASGTITGDLVAADTISGNNIAGSTITAVNMAAGAIATDALAANAVTATKIAAATIVANNIAGGTITSNEIATNTITADNVAFGSLTGDRVAANTISGNNIAANTITTGNLAAASVTTAELAAGAVTASKLVVQADNLNADPAFLDLAGSWENYGPGVGSNGIGWFTETMATNPASAALNSLGVSSCITLYQGNSAWAGASQPGNSKTVLQSLRPIPTVVGKTYELSATVSNALGQGVRVQAAFIDRNGAQVAANPDLSLLWATGATSTQSGSVTAPAGATGMVIQVLNGGAAAIPANGYAGVSNVQFREQIGGSMIIAGSLTATQIAARTIVASNLASGTLTSNEIAADTITANNIAFGTLTGDRLAANTISGQNIAGSTITGSNIAANTISGGNIQAGAVGANEIAAATIVGANIAGQTITGTNIAAQTINTDHLAAGSVQAAQVAAGAITASKLGITGDSLFPDGLMQDQAWWSSNLNSVTGNGYQNPPGAFYIDTNASPGVVAAKGSLNAWVSQGSVISGSTAANIQIVPPSFGGVVSGEFYEFRATMFNSSNRPYFSMTVQWYNGGNYITGAGVNCSNDSTTRVMSFQAQAPAGASHFRVYWDANGSTDPFTGQLYLGGITVRQAASGTLIVDGQITTSKLAAGAITADTIAAGTITGDKISSATSLPGTIEVDGSGWVLGNMRDASYNPADRVNQMAAVTRIDPGAVTISGGTTLSDWRYGGDTTTINGGAIAANTISANKLTIGQRGIQPLGITFANDLNNTISWTAGYVEWFDEGYNRQVTAISAGSASRVSQGGGLSGVAFVWFDRSYSPTHGALTGGEATAASVMSNPDNVILASYLGGNAMNANYGQTIIDGSEIRTGSVTADRMAVTSLSAISANIGTIGAGVLVAQNGRSKLDLNNNKIIFDNGSIMKVTGTGFGTTNQFIEWSGPSMDPSQCSEANAVQYLRTDGSAYFGGSLSAGTVKNAQQTTDTSATASISTDTWGSNGRARSVTFSYNWRHTRSIRIGGGGGASSSTCSATIALYRNGTFWQNLTVSGQVLVNPANSSDPGDIFEAMSGSVTLNDTAGGTSVTYGMTISSRSAATFSGSSSQADQITQSLSVVETEQ